MGPEGGIAGQSALGGSFLRRWISLFPEDKLVHTLDAQLTGPLLVMEHSDPLLFSITLTSLQVLGPASAAWQCMHIRLPSGYSLLLQQVTPVAFQVEAARRRFRLAHHCLQFLQGEVPELVCGHDFIVVQALRQIQGGGQGGAASCSRAQR